MASADQRVAPGATRTPRRSATSERVEHGRELVLGHHDLVAGPKRGRDGRDRHAHRGLQGDLPAVAPMSVANDARHSSDASPIVDQRPVPRCHAASAARMARTVSRGGNPYVAASRDRCDPARERTRMRSPWSTSASLDSHDHPLVSGSPEDLIVAGAT